MTSQIETFRHRFEMKKLLGRGGSGEVHLAFDTYAQRDVAIKINRQNLFEDPKLGNRNRRMWMNEARLAGKLQHPFIVQIFEAGATDEFNYIVMEYMANGSLKRFTTPDNVLPINRVIDILYKVCIALDFATKMGVLHRDIKPANVLLGADISTVKISDFGASYNTESDMTQVDMVGTLPFMAPEHFRSARPTQQSDIYAVGVMAYQLLTGRYPFTAKSQEDMIYQKLNEEVLSLESWRSDIPQALRFAVHRAMHQDREMRYTSWQDFYEDLAAALPQVAQPDEERFDISRFNFMRKLPFFADFLDNEIWETLGLSRPLSMGTGKTVVQQGEAGGNLYLITSGEVVVIQNGVEINRLGPGDCFGDIAYQEEMLHVHTATVTVSKNINVIEIDGGKLRQASDSLQACFSKALLVLMVSQLRKADQRILSMMNPV
ncbi:MAG TPA: protein kinase [Gallionellaceae bacterium]|nr:protein kinase [Gallionellaceae bacterium]